MNIYPNDDVPLQNLTVAPSAPVLLPFTALAGLQEGRGVAFVNLALMGRGEIFPAWFGFPDIALVSLDQTGHPRSAPQTLILGTSGQALVAGGAGADLVISYHPHPDVGEPVRQIRIEDRATGGGSTLDGSHWALSVRFPADHGQPPADADPFARTFPAALWLSYVAAASDETPARLVADPVWFGRELDSIGAFRPFDKVIAGVGTYADGPFRVLHNRGFRPVALRAEQQRIDTVTVTIEAATIAPGSSCGLGIGFDATQPGRLRASVPITAADGEASVQATLDVRGIIDLPPTFALDGPQLSAFEAHRGDTIRAIGDHMDAVTGVALMDFPNGKFHFLRAIDSSRTAVSFRIAEDVPLGSWRVGLVTQNHGALLTAPPGAPVDFTPHSFTVPAEPAPFEVPPDALPRPDGTLACDVVAISGQILTMGAWSSRAPCDAFTSVISLVATPDGRLYALRTGIDHGLDRDWVTGGHPGEEPYVPGAIMSYDAGTNTWSAPRALPLRLNVAAAIGPSGEIFMTGEDRRENYVGEWTAYDPRTGNLRACARMPSRRTRVSLTVAHGRIYALGGYSGSSIGSGRRVTVEEYDPATDTWAAMADMPFSASAFGLTTGADGIIYAAGGQGDLLHFGPNGSRPNPPYPGLYAFDPVANSWATKAPMHEGKINIGMAGGANGRIYAIGGGPTGLVVEEYDPATDHWIETAPLPRAVWRPGVATAADGTIYVAGGLDTQGWITDMMAMRP